jgi:hypothetical protein
MSPMVNRISGMNPGQSALGLGRVKTALQSRQCLKPKPGGPQAAIAAISGLIPRIFIARVRL